MDECWWTNDSPDDDVELFISSKASISDFSSSACASCCCAGLPEIRETPVQSEGFSASQTSVGSIANGTNGHCSSMESFGSTHTHGWGEKNSMIVVDSKRKHPKAAANKGRVVFSDRLESPSGLPSPGSPMCWFFRITDAVSKFLAALKHPVVRKCPCMIWNSLL